MDRGVVMRWTHLRYQSPRQTRNADLHARLRGLCMEICSGRRRFCMRVMQAAPAAWTPIRLQVRSSLGAGHLELDLAAIEPALSLPLQPHISASQLSTVLGAHSHYLCLLEGLLGTALHVDKARLHRRPARYALALEVTDSDRGRRGRIGLSGDGLIEALQRTQAYQAWQSRQQAAIQRELQVRAWICLRACGLTLAQLARARPGAVVRIPSEQKLLRLRLAQGFAEYSLQIQDMTCMIQSPPSFPRAPASSVVAVEQIMLEVDVVIMSLRLSVEEVARLRPGSTLQLPGSPERKDVTLRCEGTPFAHGELVRLGETLGVVIESTRTAPRHDQP
ncbi:MAG TPA: FliM/FliN family flagellar motor switch protein [Stenotrophomonas sp.]